MATINPPAEWSSDQALDPLADVDLYRGWLNYTQMWPTSASSTGTAGLLFIYSGGSGYVDGVYNPVDAIGGMGTGCTLNITVSGGTVTSCAPVAEGTGYFEGDILSAAPADLGGSGGGLVVQVIGTGVFKAADAPSLPPEEMIMTLSRKQLNDFVHASGLGGGINVDDFRTVKLAREAVLEAWKLDQQGK